MPKPTFLNLPDEKRQRITELAIDEFSTHPYRQASLSRIVARAGIAKGSMYQYFENKLDLYQWLVVEELERRRRDWLDNHSHVRGEGLFAELEQRALASVGFLLDHPRLARLAAAAMEPTSDAELRSLHSRLRQNELDALTRAIAEAMERGEIREDLDPRALAHLIEAMVLRGLPDAVLASAGVDVHSIDAKKSEETRIEEESWRGMVRQSLAMLQSGLTHAAPAVHA
ncbi:hypothetical protein PPSIR1_13560 [Plesiocystis pacifica SIR-1]|uniref:HTH tetR-type domain-containing protein n=1 Tax=Plesiocystis pacifica SIR-1 TaxID=391625 RepID=A6GF12_9BACT|nr:TetR/AcrR family transcriptional regulator [Plesiocystis pacifica]EDM75539.1 hypothetical protein PPSIR1_13560 [Plesiocystis pacifica SIR-1]